MRPRHQWQDLPAGTKASHYRVTCPLCGISNVKESQNVRLFERGHAHSTHADAAITYQVTPVRRVLVEQQTAGGRRG
jgi:hypothetical protein